MTATVMVQLVAERSHHKDTMYGSNKVWARRGDVQEVPVESWLKMRQHADVYREFQAPPPDIFSLAQAQIAEAAGDGVDQVMVAVVDTEPKDPGAPKDPADPGGPELWTAERVAATPEDELRSVAAAWGHQMHPRLKDPAKIRAHFLEIVAAAGDEA